MAAVTPCDFQGYVIKGRTPPCSAGIMALRAFLEQTCEKSPGMVVCTHILSTKEVEARGLPQILASLGYVVFLTLPKKKKGKKLINSAKDRGYML